MPDSRGRRPFVCRFAPSPTGRLHVGNVRVALLNWLWARREGGRFQLRLDDTDTERSTAAFAEAIQADLCWLGLDWDELFRQSDRLDRYAAAADSLRAAGRLYPCWETAEELDLKRRLALKSGRAPRYDRAALQLPADERARLEREGRRPHWRFLLEDAAVVEWDDHVRGPQRVEASHLSDPVLLREDGRPLYTLSSAVDDGETGVTLVLRGEDHVTNTAVQIQLFQALGFTVPDFAHLPLLTDAGGQGLSKRTGSVGIAALRDDGIEPTALAAYLARLGTPDPAEPVADLAALVPGFDIGRFGRATPKFDAQELWPLNARVLHALPYAAVEDWLAAEGMGDFGADLWEAVRPNLVRRQDAAVWYRVVRHAVTPVIEDADFCRQAAALLPEEPWDEDTWGAWTAAVKAASGRKGKALFHPLRLALTGEEKGPELARLLPLIGAGKARVRLSGRSG